MSPISVLALPSGTGGPHLSPTVHPIAPTEPLLRGVLSLLRAPWARDFMFKADAAADVCALLSPTQLQYAMVTDMELSVFEDRACGGGGYGGLFDLDVSIRWLLVPAFSVGHVSAEVVVQSHKRVSNSAVGVYTYRADSIRMLRDDTTGALLIAVENVERDEINLTRYDLVGTTRRRRVLVRARRDAFLDGLLAPDGFDFPAMHRALAHTVEFDEVRDCGLCAAPWARGCDCAFVFNRPAHPLDFSFCRTNLLCHRGQFTGPARITMYAGGNMFATAMLSSKVWLGPIFEHACVKEHIELGLKSKVPRSSLAPLPNQDVSLSCCDPKMALNFSVQGLSGDYDPSPFSDFPDYFANGHVGSHLANMWDSASPIVLGTNIPLPGQGSAHPSAERKLVRQIKNREAAARSNRRRKERNERRKKDIVEIREQVRRLRQRELELKMENEALRNLVKETG